MTKRPRPDNVIANLPAQLREQVEEMLLGNIGYYEIVKYLADHKVKLSQTAIARYWQNHVLPQKWARNTKAAELLDQIDCGRIDAATHSAVKQAAYELATTPGSDPKAIKLMYDLCLRAQALDNDARKISILEERAKAAELAKESLNARKEKGGLTPETLALVEETLNLL